MRPVPIQPIFCAFFDITKLSRLNPVAARERALAVLPPLRQWRQIVTIGMAHMLVAAIQSALFFR
jgi:hypothetical protein